VSLLAQRKGKGKKVHRRTNAEEDGTVPPVPFLLRGKEKRKEGKKKSASFYSARVEFLKGGGGGHTIYFLMDPQASASFR